MKQPILVDSVEIFRKHKPEPLGHEIFGIRMYLLKHGCTPVLFGSVSKHYDGISTDDLGHVLGDWQEQLLIWDRKVRYGRRNAKS